MPDQINDTNSNPAETPAGDASNDASAQGSNGGPDPVSLLTSRLNGQTAKVGELTTTLSAKEEALKAALQRVADLESGKVSAEDAAKAQVEAMRAELEAERRSRRVDSLKSRFPETFSVLGEAAFSLDEAALASNEARLIGGSGGQEPPQPLRHNETRTGAPKQAAKEKSAADYRAELLATPVPWA